MGNSRKKMRKYAQPVGKSRIFRGENFAPSKTKLRLRKKDTIGSFLPISSAIAVVPSQSYRQEKDATIK
jgi:hypothetical protein